MNKEELIRKLEDIEWEDFEVKEAVSEVPKNAWETVSAFSNTAGGWLVFGIKQIGKSYQIVGVANPQKIEQDFTTTLRSGKFNHYKIVFPFGVALKTGVKTRVEIRVKTRVKILELLTENLSISTPEIAQKVGLTIKGVEWNLKKLREAGVIERVGPTKGGYWKVKSK